MPPAPIPTDTLLVFTKKEVHALAGSKKTEILKQLEGACQGLDLALKLHVKPKKEDGIEQMQAVLEVLKASAEAPVVGGLPKEKPTGAFVEAWGKVLSESGLPVVDVSVGLGSVLAQKDDDEIKNVKKAAFLLSKAMTNGAVKEIEGTPATRAVK